MKPKLLLAAISLATSLTACIPVGNDGGNRSFEYETIEKAQAEGLEVYWIGDSYEVNGEQFDRLRADYPEGLAGVDVAGMELSYYSGDRRNLLGLVVMTVPSEEWERVEEAVREPRNIPVVRRASYQVLGRPGEMIWRHEPGRDYPPRRTLIVEFPKSVVVASVSAGTLLDGSAANPLIDPDVFVEFMQRLRPYPN